jgi:hypothetical protein
MDDNLSTTLVVCVSKGIHTNDRETRRRRFDDVAIGVIDDFVIGVGTTVHTAVGRRFGGRMNIRSVFELSCTGLIRSAFRQPVPHPGG